MSNKSILFQVDTRPGQKRKQRIILLSLVLSLFLVGILYFLFKPNEESVSMRFRHELEAGQYQQALELYRQQQSLAHDLTLPEDQRSSIQNEQILMEGIVRETLQPAFEKLLHGQDLSIHDQQLLNSMGELVSMQVLPFLNRVTENLLDGQLPIRDWDRILLAFHEVDSLKLQIATLNQERLDLERAIPAFVQAHQLEAKHQFIGAWEAWQALIHNERISRFAKRYAEQCLDRYQQKVYPELLENADRLIRGGAYYSAMDFIDRLGQALPDDQNLKQRLDLVRSKVPAEVVHWPADQAIPALAIKPLILPDRNCLPAVESYAGANLMNAATFEKLLETLYQQNFCLIRAEQLSHWPEEKIDVMVPAGKKPLLLIFDDYEFNSLNRWSGTADGLDLDQQGQLTAFYTDAKGQVKRGDYDAVTILQAFLKRHPDFSFDGGKALIVLSADENFLGHVINADENRKTLAAAKRQKQPAVNLTDSELQDEQAKAKRVVDKLKEQFWSLSATNLSYQDMGHASPADVTAILDQWQNLAKEFAIQTTIFTYPYGSHLNNNPPALRVLLDRGFHLLIGQGPKPYNFRFQRFLHMDRVAINHSVLHSWNGQQTLKSIFDPQALLEPAP